MASSLHHGVVIPIFGPITEQLSGHVAALSEAGFSVVIVDNRPAAGNPDAAGELPVPRSHVVGNHNRGLVAGGFNRGIERALAIGNQVITLLDQDSRIDPGDLNQLARSLAHCPAQSLVGPVVIDQWRNKPQAKPTPAGGAWCLKATRMLISSGTTFRASEWPALGPMHEPLEIDYVDHSWCYRALQRGFGLFYDEHVHLYQAFGERHPNRLCHSLGMQLYGPERHYTALRNLRWLVLQNCVPGDVKAKELLRMTAKPLFWLLFEPRQRANLRAVVRGLLDPLPAADLQQ